MGAGLATRAAFSRAAIAPPNGGGVQSPRQTPGELIQYLFFHKQSQLSFRGPGGVVKGLESVPHAKTRVRELASVASEGASRGLPWSLRRTI